ncbi:hypothetical protein D1007_17115 [Hordeum vulgare]|nr:hypothetical protein D1007_17115 [Hordeum vulgare]
MAMEKLPEVNPPSGRVPGRGLLALSISEALRQRNNGEIRDSGSSGRVSSRDSKYRPKEGTGGAECEQIMPEDIVAYLNNLAATHEEPQQWDPMVPAPQHFNIGPHVFYNW